MTEKIAFISGSDSNYFPMLMEWVHSIRRFPKGDDFDICILDTGLTDRQCELLGSVVTKIVKPDWPCPIPARKIQGREFLKSCICRPYLKNYFPDYDLYFWMDSDTWIQDWEGVDLFIEGAQKKHIALTAGVDRSYPKSMRVKFRGLLPPKCRSFYFSNSKKAFGRRMAEHLFPEHQLLAGAFCLHKDAPHWDAWQKIIEKILKSRRGNAFTAEQLALGVMVHVEGLPVEILPAWTHWLCEHKPLWDQDEKVFVEPFVPHERIGILHLSGFDAMRTDRSETTSFRTLNGQDIELSYRYPYFDAETVAQG